MNYKILMENWRKHLSEVDTMDPGFGGTGKTSGKDFADACRTGWSAVDFRNSFDQSIRGLPSILQIIKSVSKDKDILAVLSELGNKDFIKIVHKTDTSAMSDEEKGNLAQMSAEWSGEDEGLRLFVINWPALINQSSAGAMELINNFASFHDTYLSTSKNDRDRLWYLRGGVIRPNRVDEFVNFYGFLVLLLISLTVVHELAHAFDPDNLWNNLGAAKKIWAALEDGGDDMSSKYLPAMITKALSAIKKEPEKKDQIEKSHQARVEFFATNREKDFLNDLSSSEMFKSLFSPRLGPLNSGPFDLEKCAVSSWLAQPSERRFKLADKSKRTSFKDAIVQWRKMMTSNCSGQMARFIKIQDDYISSYQKSCSVKTGKMIGPESLSGIAAGEGDDRLAPDSLEDRETITKSRRSSGLNEIKIKIKTK